MIRLTQYSFRVLSLTCIVFIIINYPDLSYPLYFSGPLCLIPWLMYDLFLPGHISSGKLTGIILESISIISAIILLDTYLFSGFLILLFFQIFRSYQLKISALITTGFIVLYIIAKILLKAELDTLVVIIPVILLSILLFIRSKQNIHARCSTVVKFYFY